VKKRADNLSFDQPDICNNKCLSRTGVNGTWIQDWDFARDHGQYHRWVYPNGPYVARRDRLFKPSPDSPYPWRTSWKWHSDADADCQVNIMTHEKLCKVLFDLNVNQILFYGDSLTESMYTAFMNKLGDNVHVKPGGYEGSIVCTKNDGGNSSSLRYEINVLHERDKGGNAFPHSPRGVYEISNISQAFISNTSLSESAIGIFNIGAHYHNFSHYREDMDIMLQSLSLLNRPQDIYFFRSTSPGHEGCEPRNRNFDWTKGLQVTPLKSYKEYHVSSNKFDWDKFEHNNAYTKQLIATHNKEGRGAPIHFLDIYNMTVLRHDGHAAPADCLHYHNPGPVDWWNHLLFTYLEHLSKGATA